jgi:hypothetical protein
VSFATCSASYASSPSFGFRPLRVVTFGGFGAATFSVRGFLVVGADFVLGEDFVLDFRFEGPLIVLEV